jgi:hypothetical protein
MKIILNCLKKTTARPSPVFHCIGFQLSANPDPSLLPSLWNTITKAESETPMSKAVEYPQYLTEIQWK